MKNRKKQNKLLKKQNRKKSPKQRQRNKENKKNSQKDVFRTENCFNKQSECIKVNKNNV